MTVGSPVDCALWEPAWDQLVYRLLGRGPTRLSALAYASLLGFSVEPGAAGKTDREYKQKGFTAQKWFFRHGPRDGEGGKARNLVMAHAVPEAVGPHYALLFDAFRGWDVPYAVNLVKTLAPSNPAWMEEPIPPERVGSLRKIWQATGVLVATGEHVYTG